MWGIVLAAAALLAAQTGAAGDVRQRQDLQALETKLQRLAGLYTGKTTLADIGAALDLTFDTYWADKCYAGHCEIYFAPKTRSKSFYSLSVAQLSTDFVDWDHPWTAHDPTVIAEIRTGDKRTCFSAGEWNEALTRTGWEPLKPFVYENASIMMGATRSGKAPLKTLHVRGYATRRDGVVIVLAGPGDRRAVETAREVDALQSLQSCMKTVYINGYQSFYDLTKVPGSSMPH